MKRSELITCLFSLKITSKPVKRNSTLLSDVKVESFDFVMDEAIKALIDEDYFEDTELEFGDF